MAFDCSRRKVEHQAHLFHRTALVVEQNQNMPEFFRKLLHQAANIARAALAGLGCGRFGDRIDRHCLPVGLRTQVRQGRIVSNPVNPGPQSPSVGDRIPQVPARSSGTRPGKLLRPAPCCPPTRALPEDFCFVQIQNLLKRAVPLPLQEQLVDLGIHSMFILATCAPG